MQYIDAYVARKHGEAWTTAHPAMTECLAETYGIMVYQEQVSRVVNRLGGIELKRAFRLAKAISKKKTTMIEAEREPFIDGCERNGVSREKANEIFEDILKFGGYAFNKAHSTGYALVAFQTAYMKAYHPVEFMASLMTFEMSNTDKIMEYMEECRRMGIAVLPPDVNVSDNDFTVDAIERDGKTKPVLRFGLAAIKGVGEKAVRAIVNARQDGGDYKDIFDFCERVDLSACNRATIEALICCGGFDATGAMRKALTLVLDGAIESGARRQQDKKSGQMGLFGGEVESETPTKLPSDEWSESEMLAREKAALGFYVTRHPLTAAADFIYACSTCSTADLSALSENAKVTVGGMISGFRTVSTRANKKMGIATLEDLKGAVEAIVFPKDLPKFQHLLTPDSIVLISGEVDKRREQASLKVSDVTPAADAARVFGASVAINVPHPDTQTLQRLLDILKAHAGSTEVYIRLPADGDLGATIRCTRGLAVDCNADLVSAVTEALGPETVSLMSASGKPIPLPLKSEAAPESEMLAPPAPRSKPAMQTLPLSATGA
jgi:DNA polymerase-3 subunit alpha